MGLNESQKFLARLSTDAPLRARFAQDPEAVAAEFGLAADESRCFHELLSGPIAGFAGSLIRKRRGELESLLPFTLKALGPERFAVSFRRHAEGFVPAGTKKHRDDAIAFAEFLAREVTNPPWLADIARLEATIISAYEPTRRWTFLRLNYHPCDLNQVTIANPIRPRPTLIVWYRIHQKSRLRRVILARPW